MNIDEIIEMYLSKGWNAEMIYKHLRSSGHSVFRSYVRKLAKKRKELEKKDLIIIEISEQIHAESHPMDIRNALIDKGLKRYGI